MGDGLELLLDEEDELDDEELDDGEPDGKAHSHSNSSVNDRVSAGSPVCGCEGLCEGSGLGGLGGIGLFVSGGII